MNNNFHFWNEKTGKMLFLAARTENFIEQHRYKYYYAYYNEYAYHSDREVLKAAYKIHRFKIHGNSSLHKEIENKTACDDRGYLTRNVYAY